MQLCHTPRSMSVVFDEPNLVSSAGLMPVLALAEAGGLRTLVDEHLSVPTDRGANGGLKVASLVAGMAAGADCIEDMALLRHGGMGRLFGRAYAPSTLGSFLRAFSFGHVRQLDAVASRFLAGLAGRTPVAAGVDELAIVDVDDTVIEVHGYAKQGAGFGYSGVCGLNALLATVSTGQAAPLIVARRLRQGSANSARGAHPAGQRRAEDSAPTRGRRRRVHAGPGPPIRTVEPSPLHPVPQVRRPVRLTGLHLLQVDTAVETLEQPLTAPEYDRGDGDDELVHSTHRLVLGGWCRRRP